MMHYQRVILFIIILSKHAHSSNDCTSRVPSECDYVIVGAGSAGCVVAARLSEDANVTVCLFEKGGSDTGRDVSPRIETPRFTASLIYSDVTWHIPTLPQKYGIFGKEKHVTHVSGGQVLGGSSSHNGMVFVRGCKEDYDNWESLGAKGWGYDNVIPYFLKLEDNRIPENNNSDYHSKCGPITVSRSESVIKSELYHLLKNGAAELGIPEVDCNQPMPLGICVTPANIEAGIRESTSKAYLRPVMARENLHVFTDTFVEKVQVSRAFKKATGIQVLIKGKRKYIRARREVIVSSGTIHSAQLLMLSGIGPKKHLYRMKVKPVQDLPVGETFFDHVAIRLNVQLNITTLQQKDVLNPESVSEYMFSRKGFFAEIASNLMWYINTNETIHPWPDFQIVFTDGTLGNLGTHFTKDNFKTLAGNISAEEHIENGTSIVLVLLHTKSKGFVKLRSNDPNDYPAVDPAYLSSPADIRQFIKGIRRVQELIRTTSFKKADATVIGKVDQCSDYVEDSDSYWE